MNGFDNKERMMRISRTLTAATIVGIAAAVAAGPAVAAPAATKAAPTKASIAKKKKANTKIIKAIRIQNRAYLAQRTKVAACAKLGSPTTQQVRTTAKSTLTSAAKLRATSLRGINSRATTRSLTVKRNNLKKATTRLATVARQCATVRPAAAAPAATAPAPITIVMSPGSGTATPGAPGAAGAPGAPGGTALPAGTTPVQLSLSHILGGTPLDLSPVLGPNGILPGTLSIAGLDQLLGGALGQNGLVGVDVQQLLNLISTSVGSLTACGILVPTCLINNLTLTLNGTLTQVRALLNGAIAGDLTSLNSLLKVERLSDTVLRIVPVGPLAGLVGGVGGLETLLGGLQGGDNSAGLLGGLLRL